MLPNRPTNELLVDIFRYLDRNNNEKCQLVCKWWDNVQKYHETQLPLRNLGKFLNYCPKNDTIHFLDLQEKEQEYDGNNSEGLKHIVNTSLFSILTVQAYALQELLSSLEKFIDKHDVKFRVENFVYIQGDYEDVKIRFFMDNFSTIFEKVISASGLTLVLTSRGFKKLIFDPKSWQTSNMPQRLNMIINLVDDDKIFESTNKVKVGDILNFVEERSLNTYGCYTFSLKNVEDYFVEKYFKMFDSRNPVLFIREMHWRTRNEAHLHKAKKFFTENNFDYDRQTISNLPTDVYQKRYDDGWVFRCELIWELVWPHIRITIF